MNSGQLVITSVIGSGIGTAFVNYWLNQRNARRELMRSKLEELHQTVGSYGDIHRAAFSRYGAALQGDITFQTALDKYDKAAGERRDAIMRSKIDLLIPFYFPNLEPELEEFNAAKTRLLDVFRESEDARAKGEDISAYQAPFWRLWRLRCSRGPVMQKYCSSRKKVCLTGASQRSDGSDLRRSP